MSESGFVTAEMHHLVGKFAVVTVAGQPYHYPIRNVSGGIYISSYADPGSYYVVTHSNVGWQIDGMTLSHTVEFADQGIIHFYDQKATYGEFSNYYPAEISLDGKVWPTSEHYYQAQKFLGPGASDRHREYAELIRQQNTPNKAKILAGQKFPGNLRWQQLLHQIMQPYADLKIRPDWDIVKDNIMRRVVFHKMQQHPEIRTVLFSTGQLPLAEHTRRDSYWGDGGDGTGRNELGRILVETRAVLRGDPGPWIIPDVLHWGLPPYPISEPHIIIPPGTGTVADVATIIGKHITVYINSSDQQQFVVQLLSHIYAVTVPRAMELLYRS